MSKWTLKRCKANIEKMSHDLNISEIFATVLANRNIFSRKEAQVYINPEIKFFHDCSVIDDLDKAIKLLVKSSENKEKIFVYGDYDVDGVMSTVILYKVLKKYGADVNYYIPDRVEEGYGLNKDTVIKLNDMGCNVIFACDNGISALEEIKLAKDFGMKVIILDHHEPCFSEDNTEIRTDILPDADAIIDLKKNTCIYPFKMLCAGGLSFKFAREFIKFTNMEYDNIGELLSFAAIATICDIVDLLDENRIIVKNGLKFLNYSNNINIGLNKLIECRQIKNKEINEDTIGYIIGPCINASGRLESAKIAVELFITDDEKKAEELAVKLSMLNDERKNITNRAVEKITEEIENTDIINDNILVIYDNSIHESIIGIAAGRIKEKYYKPTILITDSNDFAKGSARSVEGYNIFENLYKNKELYIKFGGHAMAAGLSLKHENIKILRKKLNEESNRNYEEIIRIDKQLDFSDISLYLAKELELMRPFGKENKNAVFATKNVKIQRINFVGKDKNIIQFVFIDDKNFIQKGISFNGYDKFIDNIKTKLEIDEFNKIITGHQKNIDLYMDIVYCIEINNYNNMENVQLRILDFRLSD